MLFVCFSVPANQEIICCWLLGHKPSHRTSSNAQMKKSSKTMKVYHNGGSHCSKALAREPSAPRLAKSRNNCKTSQAWARGSWRRWFTQRNKPYNANAMRTLSCSPWASATSKKEDLLFKDKENPIPEGILRPKKSRKTGRCSSGPDHQSS